MDCLDDQASKPLPSASISAAELYSLLASGYTPIAVVIGASAMSMGTRGFGRSFRAIFRKGEIAAVSQTSSEARRNALARAEEEARRLGADLILVNEWSVRDVAEIVEVTCTATALRKTGELVPMPIANSTS